MTDSKKEIIRQLADIVRKNYNDDSPVTKKKLCEYVDSIGGHTIEMETFDESKDIDKAIVGKIYKDKDGKGFTIEYLKRDPYPVYTIAHELGHLFLHMGYMINEEKWKKETHFIDSPYYRFGYSEEESEANEFSKIFLLPENKFIDAIPQFINNTTDRIVDIEKLSKHFNVMDETVIERGIELGRFSKRNNP